MPQLGLGMAKWKIFLKVGGRAEVGNRCSWLKGSFLLKTSPSSPNYTVNSGDNIYVFLCTPKVVDKCCIQGLLHHQQFSLEAAPLRQELATPPSWRVIVLVFVFVRGEGQWLPDFSAMFSLSPGSTQQSVVGAQWGNQYFSFPLLPCSLSSYLYSTPTLIPIILKLSHVPFYSFVFSLF